VFSSASSVYGDANDLRLSEETPLRTASVYGRTKHVVEDILRDLSKANANWRMAIVRKFNPAGAHSSGMLGEAPRGRASHLIPQLCQVAAGEASELVVHGDDWDTADGTGVRDYVHVQDLADGYVRALKHTLAKPGIVTVNLGSGKATSVLMAIAAFERACGRSIPRSRVRDERVTSPAVARTTRMRLRCWIGTRRVISTRSAPTRGGGRRAAAATDESA
jgi:UDP-glucose 4-epimerase